VLIQPLKFRHLFLLALLSLCLAFTASAQDLPKSIRGYKVHVEKTSISVGDSAAGKEATAAVSLAEPFLVDASLTGLTFDLFATLKDVQASGRVDFLTFYDFRVNGISVDVDDYFHSFQLRKDEAVKLPRPIRIFVPSQRVLEAAWSEINSPASEWTVTGRVFVFGKFKKFGLSFKRVIPVDIEMKIKNPLTNRPRS
jgi:hypothetical protein